MSGSEVAGKAADLLKSLLGAVSMGPAGWIAFGVGGIVLAVVIWLVVRWWRKKQAEWAHEETLKRRNDAVADARKENNEATDNWDAASDRIKEVIKEEENKN